MHYYIMKTSHHHQQTNLPSPVFQAPPSNPNETVISNHLNLSKTFLQVLPVTSTSSTKIVHTNDFLDVGFELTLINKDFAHILRF